MLQVNDLIMYGGVGLGKIESVKDIQFSDITQKFYVLQFKNNLKINISESELNTKSNLRKICDKDTLAQAEAIMADTSLKSTGKNWNQKQREYHNKINSGDILEIAFVVACLKNKPALSFGEKNILETSMALIQEETRLVLNQ